MTKLHPLAPRRHGARALRGAVLAWLALTAFACGGGSQPIGDAAPDRVGGGDAADVLAMPDVATRCATAADCDDGIACTVDECGADSVCVHRADDTRCDDGRFCNGAERCDPAMRGCVAGTPPSCDDSEPCTTDRCDEADQSCRHDPRDSDGDGDPDRACGGGDCDDADRTVNSFDREVCNGRDDDCDGMVDEGVLSTCGNCDPTCHRTSTGGTGGAPFSDTGRRGVEFDPMLNGLVVRAEARMADYLWVPNTAESTVSKWDAATGREIARYRVGLPSGECRGACCWAGGCNQPSRVVVDGFGDAYVANRGFSMQGTVTKIAADRRDCVDRNGNGMIDTSTSATPMPYGADECVLWTANAGPVDAVLRAIAIDRGDATFPQGYPWVGGYNSRRFWKLNPQTGAVITQVDVPVRPYGAVVTADGRLWIGTLDEGATAYIDTTTATPTASGRISFPLTLRGGCNQGYGITADNRGRLWFAGWGCRDALGYDPAANQWTRLDSTPVIGGTAGRGITVDPMGIAYMAFATSGDGPSRIARWDTARWVPGGNIPSSAITVISPPPGHDGPSGLGLDRLGNLWLAHYISSQLVRYTPSTGAITSFTGPNRVYTYSDFTGSVRRTVIGTGTYTEDYDATCDAPVFNRLEWEGDTPPGTSLAFSVRTAATATGLGGATSVTVAIAPRDSSPADVAAALRAAGITPQRFARVTVTFTPTSMPIQSPVLRALRLVWSCPYPFPH